MNVKKGKIEKFNSRQILNKSRNNSYNLKKKKVLKKKEAKSDLKKDNGIESQEHTIQEIYNNEKKPSIYGSID